MKRLITFSRIPSGRPAKSCRTDFGQRTGSNSNGVSRNGEVPRNKRSRKGTSPVPFLRRDRVKIKFIGEKNVREIAREEKRYRETVARFVKEEDVQEHVKEIRARFYGALEEMLLAAIEYAKKAKDGAGWRSRC